MFDSNVKLTHAQLISFAQKFQARDKDDTPFSSEIYEVLDEVRKESEQQRHILDPKSQNIEEDYKRFVSLLRGKLSSDPETYISFEVDGLGPLPSLSFHTRNGDFKAKIVVHPNYCTKFDAKCVVATFKDLKGNSHIGECMDYISQSYKTLKNAYEYLNHIRKFFDNRSLM